MDEFEEDEDGFVSRRVTPIDFAVIGLGLGRDLAGAFETALSTAQQIVAGHANWQAGRRLFAEEAGYDIEAIASGEQEE